MVCYSDPRKEIEQEMIRTCRVAQENEETYKMLVQYRRPRKEVDQEDNMDTRADQGLRVLNNKTGSV